MPQSTPDLRVAGGPVFVLPELPAERQSRQNRRGLPVPVTREYPAHRRVDYTRDVRKYVLRGR